MDYNTYIYDTNGVVKYCTITTANEQTGSNEIGNARGRQRRQAVQTRRCGGIPADLTFCFFFSCKFLKN
jgi:hypothetical protein